MLGLCFLLILTLLGVVIAYSLYVTDQNRVAELAWSRAIKLKNEIAIERDRYEHTKPAQRVGELTMPSYFRSSKASNPARSSLHTNYFNQYLIVLPRLQRIRQALSC